MTLTTAQEVRLRIQDIPVIADVTRTFDGSASAFALDHTNVISGSAFVPGSNGQWSATGATFNTSGFVTFAAPGSANSAWRARYVHSTFSDDEIGQFTARGGSIAGAALEAAYALMFDSLKRAKWAAPDGTQYDDTKAMDMLKEIVSAQRDEIADAETLDGGYASWTEGQADW